MKNWNNDLFMLCCDGNVNKIKEYIKDHPEVNLAQENTCLVAACMNGHLDVVRYLLTDKELKNHSTFSSSGTELSQAAKNGHIEILDYLLHSQELKENISIHINRDAVFRHLVTDYISHFTEQKEKTLSVIKYLIFNLNIEKTEVIENFLTLFSESEVEKLFKMREQVVLLEKQLKTKNNTINKKI